MNRIGLYSLGFCVMCALAACSPPNDPRLSELSAVSGGPDEFRILPVKPLTQPNTYTSLPTPTPGSANLTDPSPRADAVTALGGRPVAGSEVPRADQTLVSHAARKGNSADIRETLAAEDARIDPRGRKTIGLFRRNKYFPAYRRQALDAQAELARLRAAGVRTPSAPPVN